MARWWSTVTRKETKRSYDASVRRSARRFRSSLPTTSTAIHRRSWLVSYQQNPHLDTRERGRRAASIMARTLRGEVKPVQVIVKPPMVYNIIFQNTYAEPLLPITRAAMDLEQSNPKILSVSVMGGYQYEIGRAHV